MYLLDANVFISANNNHYGMRLAPGFWSWLHDEHARLGLCSIGAVRDELLAQEDELSAWVSQVPRSFWIEERAADMPSLQSVAVWAVNKAANYTQAARNDFLSAADYRLVALAHSWQATVVTHEVSAPEAKRIVKIPDACRPFNVKCRSPFVLFEELGLVLERGGNVSHCYPAPTNG